MSNLSIVGRIVGRTQVIGGTTKAGKPWSKVTVLLKEVTEKAKPIAFTFFGSEMVQEANMLQLNDQATIYFNINSREHQGKWYTDVQAWKVDVAMPGQAQAVQMAPTAPVAPPVQQMAPVAGAPMPNQGGNPMQAPMGQSNNGASLQVGTTMGGPLTEADIPF